MRSRYLLLPLALVAFKCNPGPNKDVVLYNTFPPEAAIVVNQSNYFGTTDPLDGWDAPLPNENALTVGCAAATGHLGATYSMHFLENSTLGYTWVETFAASDWELGTYSCSPYHEPPHTYQVRRGCPSSGGDPAECPPANRSTWVYCHGSWDAGDSMNSCTMDCPGGSCVVIFVGAQGTELPPAE